MPDAIGAQPIAAPARRRYLWFEYGSLFFVLPAILALSSTGVPYWALLASATLVTLALLLTDRAFDRSLLWNDAGARRGVGGVVALWAFGAVVLSLMVRGLAPEAWLSLPRQHPALWAGIMVGYPLLSVYPQNVVYRAFVFHRYRELFPDQSMIWASAAAFSWAHVIFHNPVALMLTFAGGLIFGATYQKHRSLLLCSVEHALYGCLLFTIGLGSYLYQGRAL